MADCTPEWCAEITGLDPALVEEACVVWATRPEGQTYGNGGIHLQLAPDQIGNCTQSVRAILHLMYMTGNFDGPAGNRGLTRSPVDEQATGVPGSNMPQEVKWRKGSSHWAPSPLEGVEPDPMNVPDRIEILSNMVSADRFPLLAYYNEWADATRIWNACIEGDPYPLKGGINESGSFMNMSNANLAWEALSKLDFWVDINMFHHPGTEMADIILPCQHWLELNNIRVSQGASGGIGLTQRAIEPPADTKFDYDINRLLFETMERHGSPNGTWTNIAGDGPGAYHHDDRLEDWFQNNSKTNPKVKWEHWEDFRQDFQENGWINAKEIEPDRWGTYRRFETGWMRMGKDACTGKLFTCDEKGEPVNNFGCPTPTALVEFWPLLFENYCVDRANEIEPGRYDLLHEMMPHFDEPASGPGRRSGRPGGVPDHSHYRSSHSRVLPFRASPAALVPRAVAGAASGDEPRRRREAGAQAGRLGLDRDRVGQGTPVRRSVPRHRARLGQRRTRLVVPGAAGTDPWIHTLEHRVHLGSVWAGYPYQLAPHARRAGEDLQGHARELPRRQGHPLRAGGRHPDHLRCLRPAPEGMAAQLRHSRGGVGHYGNERYRHRPEPLRGLSRMHGRVQGREQRAYRQLLEQGAPHRPESETGATSAHDVEMYYLPVQCQHCENPECVKVCPTRRIARKLEDGTVQIDKSKCIGCQFCAMACPYGVRYLNEEERVVEKCTLCEQITAQGGLPQCVIQCGGRARFFGDLEQGIDSFEAPAVGYDVDRSYDNLYTGNRVTLGELAVEYGDADVHHLPDVGNGPHFAYILRDREWKGGE